MSRGLRPLWLYPIVFVGLSVILYVRHPSPPDPGQGLGDSWLAFFAFLTVVGYGIGVQACAKRLRAASTQRVIATSLLVVFIAPVLWFGAWSISGNMLWMTTPWWVSDGLFFFGPVVAGMFAVPMSFILSRPITASRLVLIIGLVPLAVFTGSPY